MGWSVGVSDHWGICISSHLMSDHWGICISSHLMSDHWGICISSHQISDHWGICISGYLMSDHWGICISSDLLVLWFVQAKSINQKLSCQVRHNDCVMKEKCADMARLQEELLQLKIQASTQPVEVFQLKEMKETIAGLHVRITDLEKQKAMLQEELKQEEENLKQAMTSVHMAHSLANKHLDNANKSKAEVEKMTKECERLSCQCTEMVRQLMDTDKRLQEQENCFIEDRSKWADKDNQMEETMKELSDQLTTLTHARTCLEDMNEQLMDRNQEMTNTIISLRAKLEVPMLDISTQTELSVFSLADKASQSCPDLAAAITQTAIVQYTHQEVQSPSVKSVGCAVQTITPLTQSLGCQTAMCVSDGQRKDVAHKVVQTVPTAVVAPESFWSCAEKSLVSSSRVLEFAVVSSSAMSTSSGHFLDNNNSKNTEGHLRNYTNTLNDNNNINLNNINPNNLYKINTTASSNSKSETLHHIKTTNINTTNNNTSTSLFTASHTLSVDTVCDSETSDELNDESLPTSTSLCYVDSSQSQCYNEDFTCHSIRASHSSEVELVELDDSDEEMKDSAEQKDNSEGCVQNLELPSPFTSKHSLTPAMFVPDLSVYDQQKPAGNINYPADKYLLDNVEEGQQKATAPRRISLSLKISKCKEAGGPSMVTRDGMAKWHMKPERLSEVSNMNSNTSTVAYTSNTTLDLPSNTSVTYTSNKISDKLSSTTTVTYSSNTKLDLPSNTSSITYSSNTNLDQPTTNVKGVPPSTSDQPTKAQLSYALESWEQEQGSYETSNTGKSPTHPLTKHSRNKIHTLKPVTCHPDPSHWTHQGGRNKKRPSPQTSVNTDKISRTSPKDKISLQHCSGTLPHPFTTSRKVSKHPQFQAKHPGNMEASSKKTSAVSPRGRKKMSLFQPLFIPKVSKEIKNELLPKGILRGPYSHRAPGNKSVNFPEELEIHMQGLTPRSPDTAHTACTLFSVISASRGSTLSPAHHLSSSSHDTCQSEKGLEPSDLCIPETPSRDVQDDSPECSGQAGDHPADTQEQASGDEGGNFISGCKKQRLGSFSFSNVGHFNGGAFDCFLESLEFGYLYKLAPDLGLR
ncbi:myosin-G heavy chain-like [Physella acuta]|uniref:myosin-G heavy chain-like n=1 Tax=Physella acuta TaxID=109671 RepID=UPI0027DDBF37|nr:myosin-G heavy chain-like [Physella acuta]